MGWDGTGGGWVVEGGYIVVNGNGLVRRGIVRVSLYSSEDVLAISERTVMRRQSGARSRSDILVHPIEDIHLASCSRFLVNLRKLKHIGGMHIPLPSNITGYANFAPEPFYLTFRDRPLTTPETLGTALTRDRVLMLFCLVHLFSTTLYV